MEETTLQNWALHQKENPEKSPKKLAYLPLRGTQGGWKSHPKETLQMQSRGFSRALRLLWLELTPTHPEEATGKAICKFCTKPRKIWYFFPQFRRGSRGTLQRVNKELGYGGFCPRNLSHATWVMRDEICDTFYHVLVLSNHLQLNGCWQHLCHPLENSDTFGQGWAPYLPFSYPAKTRLWKGPHLLRSRLSG